MSKNWFITGTSSGFGRLMTEKHLARGDHVTATVRKTFALGDLGKQFGDRLHVLNQDAADPQRRKLVIRAGAMMVAATALSQQNSEGKVMTLGRDELVARLIRAGELVVSGEDQAETDSYFDTNQYRLHGPDGFEADYPGLTKYFKSIRAAFEDRSIRRGIVVVEGGYVACQTWIEGRFVQEFSQSPAGPLPPNGQRVVWDLSNIFRFDDQGRMVEEWVRTDNRSFLRQLGAPGKSTLDP